MNKIKLKIICDGELINKHSEGHNIWSNPFGLEFCPCVGDIIELGGERFDEDRKTEGKQYKVIERTFKAYQTWNNNYCDKECILEVEEIYYIN